VVSLVLNVGVGVDVPGIGDGDPRAQGMVDDAMRNLVSVLKTTPAPSAPLRHGQRMGRRLVVAT
jgi:hypothetical protein